MKCFVRPENPRYEFEVGEQYDLQLRGDQHCLLSFFDAILNSIEQCSDGKIIYTFTNACFSRANFSTEEKGEEVYNRTDISFGLHAWWIFESPKWEFAELNGFEMVYEKDEHSAWGDAFSPINVDNVKVKYSYRLCNMITLPNGSKKARNFRTLKELVLIAE